MWSEEQEHNPKSLLTEDLCIINNTDFFIRGVIEIPVHDYKHEFGWGVWITHKRENFEIYRTNPDTSSIGPFFGWLSNQLNVYTPSTVNLKAMAEYRGNGLRPKIIVEPTDHPVAIQQRDGISLAEAWAMVHRAT
jgi:hypothetical protein